MYQKTIGKLLKTIGIANDKWVYYREYVTIYHRFQNSKLVRNIVAWGTHSIINLLVNSDMILVQTIVKIYVYNFIYYYN